MDRGFFQATYGPNAKTADDKSGEKARIFILQYGPNNDFNKIM